MSTCEGKDVSASELSSQVALVSSQGYLSREATTLANMMTALILPKRSLSYQRIAMRETYINVAKDLVAVLSNSTTFPSDRSLSSRP